MAIVPGRGSWRFTRQRKSCRRSLCVGALNETTLTPCGLRPRSAYLTVPSLPLVSIPCSTISTERLPSANRHLLERHDVLLVGQCPFICLMPVDAVGLRWIDGVEIHPASMQARGQQVTDRPPIRAPLAVRHITGDNGPLPVTIAVKPPALGLRTRRQIRLLIGRGDSNGESRPRSLAPYVDGSRGDRATLSQSPNSRPGQCHFYSSG